MKKKALIIGYGKSGQSAAKLAEAKGFDVVVADKNPNIHTNYQLISDQDIVDPKPFSIVVVSPGVSQGHTLYKYMRNHHVNVVGEAQFALSFLHQKCFGITGTNGKTTTTLFLEHLLKTNHQKAKAVGNIGFSFSSYALNPDPSEILICELSSFQLETLKGPFLDSAAILNVSPDHLDRYEEFNDYALAKCSIFQGLKSFGKIFVDNDEDFDYENYISKNLLKPISKKVTQTLLDVKKNPQNVFDIDGLIWLKNLSEYFNICDNVFMKAVETFKKPSHRIEFVEKISDIRFYNDSKATNIESVIFALKHFSDPIHLIVGGKDKGFDFSLLKPALSKNVIALYAIGEMQEKIDMSLNKHIKVLKVDSLEKAVKEAFFNAKSGDIVLLSPGCSSYDQFENYESRGEFFKKYVLELKEKDTL